MVRRLHRPLFLVCWLVLACAAASVAAPLRRPPAGAASSQPASATRLVRVASEAQLQSAIARLRSGTTVVLAPGVYRLTRPLVIRGAFTDIGLRGESGRRDDVILEGHGMARPDEAVPYGIWTGGGVQGIAVAHLSLRGFYRHALIFNAGTQRPHVTNVRLTDIGEQFIKSNPGGADGAVHHGVVEDSILEYTTTARSDYTNGIDVHGGRGWVIRRNLFRNIQAPDGQLAGPAVLMWNHARDTVTEGNTFVNCARGISYGLIVRAGHDHRGGLIRNNVMVRAAGQRGDVGIHVADSPGTLVLHNTVFLSGTYATPIEYRFPGSQGLVLANNLLDGPVGARDGARGLVLTNMTGATADLFVDAAHGDLHLRGRDARLIDRGTPRPEVTDDMDGERRPAGAGYDIGADEVAAGPVSSAPPS